jgi:hypothetical protein
MIQTSKVVDCRADDVPVDPVPQAEIVQVYEME